MCCNSCWRRAPFYVKTGFKVVRKRSNWSRWVTAKIKLIDWLKAHYEPHFDRDQI